MLMKNLRIDHLNELEGGTNDTKMSNNEAFQRFLEMNNQDEDDDESSVQSDFNNNN